MCLFSLHELLSMIFAYTFLISSTGVSKYYRALIFILTLNLEIISNGLWKFCTQISIFPCSTLICNHVRQACSAHVCCVAYPFAEIRNTELSSTYQERWSWIPNQKIKRKNCIYCLLRSTKAMSVPLNIARLSSLHFIKIRLEDTTPFKTNG